MPKTLNRAMRTILQAESAHLKGAPADLAGDETIRKLKAEIEAEKARNGYTERACENLRRDLDRANSALKVVSALLARTSEDENFYRAEAAHYRNRRATDTDIPF